MLADNGAISAAIRDAPIANPKSKISVQVGAETFRLCRELVDGVVLVDNGAISAAIRDVFNETRCILEPAGAVAVAGAKAYLRRHGLQVPMSAASSRHKLCR